MKDSLFAFRGRRSIRFRAQGTQKRWGRFTFPNTGRLEDLSEFDERFGDLASVEVETRRNLRVEVGTQARSLRPGPPAGSCRGHYSGRFAPSLAPFAAPVVVSFVLCQAFFVPCFVLW